MLLSPLRPATESPLRSPLQARVGGGLRSLDFAALTDAQLQSRFGWVRSGAGTLTDVAGAVRYGAHNLLTQSQNLAASPWATFINGTGVEPVRTGAYAAAPDGSMTATRVQLSLAGGTSSSDRAMVLQNIGYAVGQRYACGFWMRSLSGTVSIGIGADGIVGNVPASITTNWAFFSLSGIAASTGSFWLQLRGAQSPAHTNAVDLVVWGGQVCLGDLTDYVPTTTAPVYLMRTPDYTHGVPGLLLEGARTNRLAYTEDFSHATWVKSNVTVTANAAVAPDGATTADTLTATAANGTVLQTITPGAGAQNQSLYLKRLTGTGAVQLTADGSTWATVTINSSTWTRCDVTQTAPSGAIGVGIRLVTSGDAVYAWGAQHE